MIGFVARLSRIMPLIIALLAIAGIIYVIVSRSNQSARGKEILIRVFLYICSAISIVFLLITLYAMLDRNGAVIELALSCAIVGLVGLAITLICRQVFRKNHPHYRHETTERATPVENVPMRANSLLWMLYDLIGKFRPKD